MGIWRELSSLTGSRGVCQFTIITLLYFFQFYDERGRKNMRNSPKTENICQDAMISH